MDKKEAIQISHKQLNDPILRIPFSKFHNALEIALDRPIFTSEIGISADGLRAEIAELTGSEKKEKKE